jgi:formate C-acetyltransferase
VDRETISGVSSFKAGYIDKENEVIAGLQTDALL